ERTLVASLSTAFLEVDERRSRRVQFIRPHQDAGLAERRTSKRTHVRSSSLERDRAAHHVPRKSLAGEEFMEADQPETLGEDRVVTLSLRQIHRCTSVNPRAVAIADRLR